MTEKEKMHTIILKEKDKDGDFIGIDADSVMPTKIFGDSCPAIAVFVGDRAFFIPVENMLWLRQNYGAKTDAEMAERMAKEFIDSKKKETKKDRAFG